MQTAKIHLPWYRNYTMSDFQIKYAVFSDIVLRMIPPWRYVPRQAYSSEKTKTHGRKNFLLSVFSTYKTEKNVGFGQIPSKSGITHQSFSDMKKPRKR